MAARSYYYTEGNTVRRASALPDIERRREEKKEKVVVKDVLVFPAVGISNLIILTITAVLIVTLSVSLIKLKETNASNRENIHSLSARIDKLALDNDAEENKVLSSIDYNAIYDKAIGYGMVKVSNDQVKEYKRGTLEYVKQYKEVPEVK
ncbi:MAG TPA: hypothetical protein DCX21_07185 [Eubacterium sp.]|nr:hypothetical protein [Eubacterium sp.]HBZ52692.1 hypothetical protein [Eubacterium sp.]